jgi:hypothetical protein
MNNIQTVLEKLGYVLKDMGNEWRTKPLYRESDNNSVVSIQKKTGLYYDFADRTGGNLKDLVKRTLKLTSCEDAEKILLENSIDLEKKDTKYVSFITMQTTFDKNMLLRLIKQHDYWIKRGISSNVLEQFKGGITFNGSMTNRYVFPIFNSKDELVGFAGRLLKDNPDFPKWKLIGQKSHWLYPLHINKQDIVKKKSVILVESIGDMLALFECGVRNVLVIFGVDLSEKMIEFLLKMDMQKITVALNDDQGNGMVGNDAALEIKEKLCNYFDENQIDITTPEHKDFNEWLKNDRAGLENFLQKFK